MKSKSLAAKGKLFGRICSQRTRYLLTILLAALGIAILPSIGRATITFDLGICNPSDECNQSVNAATTNSGTTVVGDTNPPFPQYNVFATSNGTLVLHWSGSTIDTGVGGPGFTLLTLTPQIGYAWTTIEFQLDSFNKDQPLNTLGLTLTAIDQFGTSFSSGSLKFPWEGNSGENQHYHVHALAGEVITQLRISYTDPLGGGNTINDIHNIDVASVRVPEPSSFLLVGLSLLAVVGFLRRVR